MKRILRPALFAALVLGASTTGLFAQTPSPGPQGSPPDGPPPGHHGPPPSPLFRALDTNHDGVISAEEIAAAPAVLKALAGSSGQITRESLRPQRRDDDRRPQPDGSQGPGPEHENRRHHGPPPDDEGPEHQGRHHGPPPDAQDSPAANPDGQTSPSPRPQHRPDDRRHGPPPPDGEPRDQRKPQGAPSPGGSPGASPGASPSARQDDPHHGPPHGDRLFDSLDTNHDGIISADEIAAAATSLKKTDTNSDGQIDHRDMRPPPRRRRPPRASNR